MPTTVNDRDQELSFVIRKRLGVLSTSPTGWRKELNLVEWNGRPAKLDIREWDPDHAHMSKGVTLRREEAERLRFLLYRFLTGEKKEGRTEDRDGGDDGQSDVSLGDAADAETLDAGLLDEALDAEAAEDMDGLDAEA